MIQLQRYRYSCACAFTASLFLFAAMLSAAVTVPPPVTINVSPDTATVRLGSTKTFQASVANSSNTSVEWQVNGVKGGNASTGTVDANGLYTPPAAVPSPNTVTVKAVSQADKTKSDSSTVTLLNAIPTIASVDTTNLNTKLPVTIDVKGANFTPKARILLDDKPVTTTVVSSTQVKFTFTPTAAVGTKIALKVQNPDPGAAESSARTLTVVAAVSVTVTPDSKTLRVGGAQDFNASIANNSNKAVTWYVGTVKGGNSTIGTIDANGLYTAPAKVPTPNTVSVKAVSAADPTQSDSSVVTLLNLAPAITSLDTYNVNINLPVTIDLRGTNFLPTAKVLLDGKAVTTTFISATELKFTFTPTAPATTKIAVKVENPDPGLADSSAWTLTVVPSVAVNVYPDSKTLRGGATQDFNASISNNANKNVTWFVNDVKGGNAVLGLIDAAGIYTAPVILPAPPTVTIKGVSVADPKASDVSTVTLLNPVPVIKAATPSTLTVGAFSLQLTGTGFAKAAKVLLGKTQLTTTWVSATQLKADSVAEPPVGGYAVLSVVNPDPGTATSNAWPIPVKPAKTFMSLSAASRFLEQASWGPTPASVDELQNMGVNAWLNQQFAAPASVYPDPVDMNEGLSRLQKVFIANALTGKDQLRQRAAFALGQIFVVSGVTDSRYDQMVPYERLLINNAFGNYYDIMREVTLSPSMGIYLNMVNNAKPDLKKNILPNENYGRELLQLFTIGLFELNQDGTRKLDPSGNPISPYSEDTVKKMALAFTGWTFPPQPGYASTWKNQPYFFGQMVPFNEQHDMTKKPLLNGVILPPNRTAQEDLDAALKNIFNHANVGPFVALRLIQRLTTSNPSPAYVGAVAAAFNNTGGVRGDMKGVIRAILTHPEAGNAAALGTVAIANPPVAPALPAVQGHLREPVLFAVALLRALDADNDAEPNLPYETENMGQKLLFPPSVFNYFSPSYRIPGLGVVAPEFQILNPATALARVNFVYHAVNNRISNTIRVDTSALEQLAADSNPNTLIDAVNQALFAGQMPQGMQDSIAKALASTTDRRTRARNALYLAATSSLYQVQR